MMNNENRKEGEESYITFKELIEQITSMSWDEYVKYFMENDEHKEDRTQVKKLLGR